MKNEKTKKIYWGIVFISIAVLVILNCIGINIGFVGQLPVTDIVLSVIILSIAVISAVNLDLWAIPFELSFIFMLFESELAVYLGREDENIISNWLLLGCALLISIGLSLLVNPFRKRKFHFHNISKCSIEHGTHENTDFDRTITFGSESKYIDCTTFETYSYCVKMGDGNIFFENIENYKGGGTLNVVCKMGDIVIHVPSSWNIVTKIETSMGNVDVAGNGTADGPMLTIAGSCKMGNIDIKYC